MLWSLEEYLVVAKFNFDCSQVRVFAEIASKSF